MLTTTNCVKLALTAVLHSMRDAKCVSVHRGMGSQEPMLQPRYVSWHTMLRAAGLRHVTHPQQQAHKGAWEPCSLACTGMMQHAVHTESHKPKP